MKIKIISDLHLGIKGSLTNDTYLDDDYFLCYLNECLTHYDLIIFNGDVFELWEDFFSSEGLSIKDRCNTKLQKIIGSWKFGPLLVSGNQKIIIINGNHDSSIRIYDLIPNVFDHFLIEQYGHRLYVTHGHQGDFWNSDDSILRFCSCCCSNTRSELEKLVDPSLDENSQKLANLLENVGGNIITKLRNHAIHLAECLGCDVIVYGHTHIKDLFIKNKIIYVNDGCAKNENIKYQNTIDECNIFLTPAKVQINVHKINIITGEITDNLHN